MPYAELLDALGRHVATMVSASVLPIPAACTRVDLRLDALDALPAPIVLAVFDGSRASPDQVAAARAAERLFRVPFLVLAETARQADYLAVIPSAEVAEAPATEQAARELSRRVGLLAELGAARLCVDLVDRAMAEGATALTVAEGESDAAPLVFASPSLELLTGWSANEAVGRDPAPARPRELEDVSRSMVRKASRTRQRVETVVRDRRKDGSSFWNAVTAFPLVAQGVRLPFVGGVQRDVTDLVAAKARFEELMGEARKRASFVQAVLDVLDVGVVTADERGRVSFANAAARPFLDGEPWSGRLLVEALDVKQERVVAALLGKASTSTETRPSGTSMRDVEITLRGVAEANLDGVAVVAVLRDVTVEQQLHEEMRRVERLAAMGTMVAGFAHEVRNPVASLRAMAEQLDEDLAELGHALPHAKRMLKVLDRIETLVDTSLRFGRPPVARRTTVRPWEILASAISGVQPRTRPTGEDVRVDVEPDLPSVSVDLEQISQVLVILLQNALDVVGAPHRVTLRACSTRGGPDLVRFEVADEGSGIPPSVAGRIFDPFFTTKASGLGLGLSIAQQLTLENGGKIDVHAPPGGPTTFGVTFAAKVSR